MILSMEVGPLQTKSRSIVMLWWKYGVHMCAYKSLWYPNFTVDLVADSWGKPKMTHNTKFEDWLNLNGDLRREAKY